jgi:hypothetical protein
VYGTAEDEQGVGSAMTRQRRGFGGWRAAGELCWWMQDRMMSVGGDRCWKGLSLVPSFSFSFLVFAWSELQGRLTDFPFHRNEPFVSSP